MPLLERGVLTTPKQIEALGILDFARTNGYWDTPSEAVAAISNLLIENVIYSIFAIDLAAAPEHPGWLGWHHVGHHPATGRLYWNWFYAHHPEGQLVFGDQPDFHGTFTIPADSESGRGPRLVRFWGDIGQVAPSTLVHTMRLFTPGDIWISVDQTTQIVLQPTLDLRLLLEILTLCPDDSATGIQNYLQQHYPQYEPGPYASASAAFAATQGAGPTRPAADSSPPYQQLVFPF